jgi:hypothetical protein
MKKLIISFCILTMLGCSKDDIITPITKQNVIVEKVVNYKNQTTNSIRLQSKSWEWFGGENASFYSDIDLDGDEDVFISNEQSNPIIKYNNGSGYTETKLNDGYQIFPRSIIGNDFNGDGYIDFIVLSHNDERLNPNPGETPTLFINESGKGFKVSKLNTKSAFWHLGSSADIDKDGDVDILICTAGSITIMINDGMGNFKEASGILPISYSNCNLIGGLLEDINKDGYIDLLVYGAEFNSLPSNTMGGQPFPSKTRILWGSSNGKYEESNSLVIANDFDGFGLIIDALCVDLDKDGNNEIILDRTGDPINSQFYKGYKIQILTDGIDVTDKFILNASSKTDDWIVWIRVQDVNGDYKLDILEGVKRRVKFFLQK